MRELIIGSSRKIKESLLLSLPKFQKLKIKMSKIFSFVDFQIFSKIAQYGYKKVINPPEYYGKIKYFKTTFLSISRTT